MRECGNCHICCKIVKVEGNNFLKPAGELCIYCDDGCEIYKLKDRPKVCKSFQCAWSRGFGKIKDRPDKVNVMLSISEFNGGVWVFVMETKKGAYKATGKRIIKDLTDKMDIPVIVSDFDTKQGEDFGDYVIIKEKLEKRSKHIKGDFMFQFADKINVYGLNGSNSHI